jgi:hypothetical protein
LCLSTSCSRIAQAGAEHDLDFRQSLDTAHPGFGNDGGRHDGGRGIGEPPMWLIRISKYDPEHDLRTFECKVCEHSESTVVKFK